METNIEKMLMFTDCRGSITSTWIDNLPERLNEEIKRRTLVLRIFPDIAACLWPVRRSP
jgi:transposase-like protein